ncbi:ABC transporter substrate-binding protein (plasmid) [Roseomonas gilardii]|jgi:peptide/nickel transport system substrate-binding protein|uniref:ABC transporter substrate-binding protein n=1 Tax=Roseomonas gilardii TaxID=257708 RepID=A0A1L7ANL8_9PROT|nr:ABC transporter substrate-binding protein [Roseomonas gilardii]APT60378.1 ABC transporter substrate-binding protein [Roseomonas gilardii]
MRQKIVQCFALCAPLALAMPAAAQPAADRVLRVAPHADLRNLDPVSASIVITRMHGLMIYESLFAWDSKLIPRPQMVDRFEQSEDGLSWTFHLRDGLRFHDGQAVTTRDVIPSLNRWMARDTLGGKLKEYVSSLEAADERTLVLRLHRPMGLVPFALGSAVGYIPVVMREADAATDPFKAVTTTIGSGPFRFNRGEWQPGARVVYDRNPDYVPRREPADGLAGGRVVKVDRVEWHILPDPATAAAALQTGEIDIWEQPAQDLIPSIERARGIQVQNYSSLPNQALLRPNQLHRPFSDPRVRQAMALLTDQGDFLAAGFGDERFWKRCNSYFVCGSPNGTEAGAERFGRTDVEAAKRLLADAGYRGEKVVLISTHEIPYMGRMAEVAAQSLARGGINVDLQFTDWGAVSTRLQNRETNDKGGWDMFITSASGPTMQSPVTNIGTNMGCARGWVGWPCDAEAERLRAAVVDARDDTARAEATEALHRRLAEMQPYRVLGQYDQPYARRASVSPVLAAPIMVFWNVEKR